jgi:hypothetical protein
VGRNRFNINRFTSTDYLVQHQVVESWVLMKIPSNSTGSRILGVRLPGRVDNYVAAKASEFNRFQQA